MTSLTISSGQRSYTVTPVPAGPLAHRSHAVLQARLVDELNGLGLRGAVSLNTALTGLSARVAGDGLVGFVANPARRFTDLVANNTTIGFRVTAPRYVPRNMSIDLGPFNTGLGDPADFPHHFDPADLGDILLHRRAVRIAGHVMRELGEARTPLAGVDVHITGIWSSEPGPNVEAQTVVEAPDIISIAPGLYRDRPTATTMLRAQAITLAGSLKRLLAPAAAGASEVWLSDQTGLVVGDLLSFADGDVNATEVIEITAIAGGLTPAEPATVTLAYPLKLARRAGDIVDAASLSPGPGPQVSLSRPGLTGDETLPLAAMPAGLPTQALIEVSGDGAPEYHVARRFETQTDARGAYRLPPLSRVARLTLTANRADFAAPLSATIAPDYGREPQQIDFLERP